MSANDIQVGGGHYKTGGIEHWDYVIQCLHGRYLEGNISRYVFRCYRKGRCVEDLEKALHYIQKLKEMVERKQCRPMGETVEIRTLRNPVPEHVPITAISPLAINFCRNNCLTEDQSQILCGLTRWTTIGDLDYMARIVERMLGTARLQNGSEPTDSYVNQD